MNQSEHASKKQEAHKTYNDGISQEVMKLFRAIQTHKEEHYFERDGEGHDDFSDVGDSGFHWYILLYYFDIRH